MLGTQTFRLEGVVVPGTVHRIPGGVPSWRPAPVHRVDVVEHTATRRSSSSPTSPSWWSGHFVGRHVRLGPDHRRPHRAVHPGASQPSQGAERDRRGERRPRAQRRPARPGGVGRRRRGDRLRAGPATAPSSARTGRVYAALVARWAPSSPPWPWSARSSPTTSRSPSWPPTTAARRRCSTRSPACGRPWRGRSCCGG